MNHRRLLNEDWVCYPFPYPSTAQHGAFGNFDLCNLWVLLASVGWRPWMLLNVLYTNSYPQQHCIPAEEAYLFSVLRNPGITWLTFPVIFYLLNHPHTSLLSLCFLSSQHSLAFPVWLLPPWDRLKFPMELLNSTASHLPWRCCNQNSAWDSVAQSWRGLESHIVK